MTLASIELITAHFKIIIYPSLYDFLKYILMTSRKRTLQWHFYPTVYTPCCRVNSVLEILMLEAWILQRRTLFIYSWLKGGQFYWCTRTNRTLGQAHTQECQVKTVAKTGQGVPKLDVNPQRLEEPIYALVPQKAVTSASTLISTSGSQKWETVTLC